MNRQIIKAINGRIGKLTPKAAYYLKQHKQRRGIMTSAGAVGAVGVFEGIRWINARQ